MIFAPENRAVILVPMTSNYRAWLWCQLAEEARAAAQTIKDKDLRLQVLLVAARYLVMAKRAEKAADPSETRSIQ